MRKLHTDKDGRVTSYEDQRRKLLTPAEHKVVERQADMIFWTCIVLVLLAVVIGLYTCSGLPRSEALWFDGM